MPREGVHRGPSARRGEPNGLRRVKTPSGGRAALARPKGTVKHVDRVRGKRHRAAALTAQLISGGENGLPSAILPAAADRSEPRL